MAIDDFTFFFTAAGVPSLSTLRHCNVLSKLVNSPPLQRPSPACQLYTIAEAVPSLSTLHHCSGRPQLVNSTPLQSLFPACQLHNCSGRLQLVNSPPLQSPSQLVNSPPLQSPSPACQLFTTAAVVPSLLERQGHPNASRPLNSCLITAGMLFTMPALLECCHASTAGTILSYKYYVFVPLSL